MRTDRTFVCTDCRVRCWPVSRCPACGETDALVDLEASPELVARAPSKQGPASADTGLLSAVSVASGIGSVFAMFVGLPGVGEVGIFASVAMLMGAAIASAKKQPKQVPGDLRYRVLDSPVVRARADRVIQEGRVRARATLEAPVSHRPCVAWRIWAEGPHGPIDDAMGVVFSIAVAGEPEVEVDATIASIELPKPHGEPIALRPGAPGMIAWLRARGVDRLSEPLMVREAILVEGDLVEVVATARRETRADGYRGASSRDVLADLPGSPLIVRPAAPSPSAAHEPVPNP